MPYVVGAGSFESLRVGAVIALKPISLAKTRMSATAPELRSRLALAMALDVAAALSSHIADLVVVSNEPRLDNYLRQAGLIARVIDDPAPSGSNHGPHSGLNAALAHGAAFLGCDLTVAVVADLPCLRSVDVAAVIDVASGDTTPQRWFCPDLSRTGTTMLMARRTDLQPLFEGASASRHKRSGATELTLPTRARLDVDTAHDLGAAAALGLGPATRELVVKYPSIGGFTK